MALEDVPAKLVYVPTADGLELAWRLNVQTLDQAHWYDAFVDADSGESIYTNDWVGHASYRVIASPLESPNDGPRTLVTDPHDIHYQYGFTEAAGNFQVNNYGHGGLGNDPVIADLQDGDGGGPSFVSPPDGQSRGMSEGWGDWWAIMLTQKSTDAKLDAVPIGAYYFNMPGGGRRYPYSFNMTINPLTYGDYNNPSTRNSQHAIGLLPPVPSSFWPSSWGAAATTTRIRSLTTRPQRM